MSLPATLRAAAGRGEVVGPGHWIVQFAEAANQDILDALRNRGAEVLLDVPDNAVVVFARRPLDLEGMDVVRAAPFDPRQKLSALLPPPGAARSGGTYLVEFHADIELNDARRLLLGLGLELREHPDLGPHRLLARARPSSRAPDPLPRIASLDEAAYIFPASAELASGQYAMPCMSALSTNAFLGQYIAALSAGWDGPGLGAATLGYIVEAVPGRLTAEAAQSEVLRAMAEWSRVVQVDWKAAAGTAARTVRVVFGKRNHGDNYPFDGPGRILAHTFYPAPPNPEPIAGDMHLDADEDWRIGANIDLYSVALHELGHALGLGHSDDPASVMYPYYRLATSLRPDDENAIKTLYAARAGNPSAPAPPPPPPSNPPANPTRPPSPGETTPPHLTISSPGATTLYSAAPVQVFSGTASDASGITEVTWETNVGKSGAASGTTRWRAEVPLLVGNNRVTIRAHDGAGNVSWRTVVVIRR